METYLNAFIRAAQEGKDFYGMPAWLVKIIVEDMLKERDAAIATRDAAIRKESKWISVKERLPKEYETVLINSIYGVFSAYLYDGDWKYAESNWMLGKNVTHWMPLPEPPVGKEGEE